MNIFDTLYAMYRPRAEAYTKLGSFQYSSQIIDSMTQVTWTERAIIELRGIVISYTNEI